MTTKLLSEISTNISSGLTPLRSNAEFWENGTIPWLKTEQLGEKYIYETNEHISEAALEKTSIKLFPENSLSIAMYGEGKTRGNLSILKKAMATNQACCNVVIDPSKADFEYVYYFLKTQYDELRNLSSGVRKNLNSNDIKNYPIRLPENLDNQKRIANVLNALDKKIELNNRINAELEAMAKTLYDYWFVQFDFPDANGKPYKTSGGKMVYNPTLKREIPEGWEDSTIGAIEPNIVTGKTPSKDNPEYFGGNVPFITIGDIRGNTYIVSTEETLTASGAATQKNKFLPEDSICVTCIASPGLVGFVTTPAQTNQQINSVVCSNQINKYYLYFAIKGYFEGAKAKTGNTFSNMNKGDFSAIVILKPSDQALQDYHLKAYPLFEKIKLKSLENKQLVKLRDWLLPMLMNGQVTVGEAS
ncbi:TPA: restriction endonuclease subunit S [Vibrio cholerae]|jgi:type I restriction enzyme S subunit|nr:restriction endonuclease subunit S [Vibrio cholerae]GHY85070.1 Restriction modification system DNA specificity domain protein [Vibrio cholerae]HDI3282476.1 restriction endonuclease subunit S [Vibrio cholerae]